MTCTCRRCVAFYKTLGISIKPKRMKLEPNDPFLAVDQAYLDYCHACENGYVNASELLDVAHETLREALVERGEARPQLTTRQEIQDLMPKLIDGKTYDLEWSKGYKFALTEVEAVLPQIIALAEKRGAEGERERIRQFVETDWIFPPPDITGYQTKNGQPELPAQYVRRMVLTSLLPELQTLTQPNHDR